MSESQNSEFERKLQGRTLRVYLYLQRKKTPSGIREVQRELGLSSPSVADYQVEKLVEMGLATRDWYGRVYVTRHVRVKALQSYVNLGQFMIPRLAFYATIFTAVTASYLILSAGSATVYGAAVPTSAAGIFWFEAIKMWRIQLGERALVRSASHDNRLFWASLAPGLGALAVFLAAAFFLFYYVDPIQTEPEVFPVDTNRFPESTDRALIADDMNDMNPGLFGTSGSHQEIVSNFPTGLIAGFLGAGAVVAGFLVYILLKCRCKQDVLELEQT